MAIMIHSGLTDDNDFIELLSGLLTTLVRDQSPEQLWIVQIDNWFDHKWLRFSGNGAIGNPRAAGLPFMDQFASVKKQFWRAKLTFPPFAPDRILGQWSFQQTDAGYVEQPLPKLPHSTEKRFTAANLQRRVQDFTSSAIFVWYSANTLKNGRGSLMVYCLGAQEPVCWFAAFARNPKWGLQRTKGIEREAVQRLMKIAESTES